MNKQDLIDMKKVAGLLKKRFPNLKIEETIELATEILLSLEGYGEDKQEDK